MDAFYGKHLTEETFHPVLLKRCIVYTMGKESALN